MVLSRMIGSIVYIYMKAVLRLLNHFWCPRDLLALDRSAVPLQIA